jgi:hypothetical protein
MIQTQREERSTEAPTADLHHVRCGECKPNVALCGTALDGAAIASKPAAGEALCVVCFSGTDLTCPACGLEIEGATA